jgi:FtsH-binding integral membrane protein
MSMFPNSNVKPIELEFGTNEKAMFHFFNAVYAWMAVGLAVTATVAYFVSQSPTIMRAMFVNKFMFVVLLLGLYGLAMAVQVAAARISWGAAVALFMLYAALIGAMFSFIFIVYPMSTLAGAFFMTAGTFGATSVYGFITKRDLTTIGSFLFMAFIGIFLASIVNIFLANNALSWLLTYAILAIFIGLVAYRTQQLKRIAQDHLTNGDIAARYAIIGSLILYISFINMFMSILRIMGSRK